VMVASQITKGEITRAIVRKYQISPKYAKTFIDTARYRNTPHINKQADQRLADESDFLVGRSTAELPARAPLRGVAVQNGGAGRPNLVALGW
jgi:hypothetical protein